VKLSKNRCRTYRFAKNYSPPFLQIPERKSDQKLPVQAKAGEAGGGAVAGQGEEGFEQNKDPPAKSGRVGGFRAIAAAAGLF